MLRHGHLKEAHRRPGPVQRSLPPREVLAEACDAIEKARFTGTADSVTVPHMLAEFEYIVGSTFEQALEDHATSGATLPPSASHRSTGVLAPHGAKQAARRISRPPNGRRSGDG